MKVLVTGATGLVGHEIVSELHKKGYGINYLTTRKTKISSQENYQGFLWNPTRNEIDLKCFEGVAAIINLAGASIAKRWSKAYKKEIFNSRINSLSTLRKGLLQVDGSNIKTMVTASAIGIYPNSPSTLYDEDFKGVDDSFLGEVVQAWEKEADAFGVFDLKLAKVRIGMVLSSQGGALPQMAFPVKNFIGAALGSGEQWQSWIHVNDLARMFSYIIENGMDGVYNATAPNPVTNAKMTKELAKVLSRPLILPNLPKFILRMVLGKMSYIVLASQRVSSKKIENFGFKFNHVNICGALEAIYGAESDKIVVNGITENGCA